MRAALTVPFDVGRRMPRAASKALQRDRALSSVPMSAPGVRGKRGSELEQESSEASQRHETGMPAGPSGANGS
jgi:hypothetical protein